MEKMTSNRKPTELGNHHKGETGKTNSFRWLKKNMFADYLQLETWKNEDGRTVFKRRSD